MRFRILLLMTSKHEQSLKQQYHPHQKIYQVEITSKN